MWSNVTKQYFPFYHYYFNSLKNFLKMCTLMFLKVQVDFNDLGGNNY